MLIRDVAEDGVDWDSRTDIVIVGGGGAGLVAATAASEHSVEVALFEKQQELGGNTKISHATSLAAETIPQEEAGIDDSAEQMAEDLMNYTGYDEELTWRLSEESGDTINWLIEDVGLQFTVNPEIQVDGCTIPRSHYPVRADGSVPENGEPLIETLQHVAREQGVQIETGIAIEQLVVDDGSVVGVVTEGSPASDGGLDRRMIQAEKVLLATNGITANRELRIEEFPHTENLEYWASRGNTGDGYRWGKELNAEIDIEPKAVSLYPLVTQPEGFHLLIDLGRQDGALIVNENCNQFGNIDSVAAPLNFSYDILDQPKEHAYVVFDHRTYVELSESPYTEHRFEAALDREVFSKRETIEGIARELGIDPSRLKETVSHVNALAENGESDEYDHTRDDPLEPPFYGTKVKPAVIENSGGIRVNEAGQVLTESGEPIPNLFAAGSVTAGIGGLDAETYIPGMRMLNVLSLGKIMGRQAATEVAGR